MSAQPGTLPVFHLDHQSPNTDHVTSNLLAVIDLIPTEIELNGDWRIHRQGDRRFDVNLRTCEVWYADESRLWKPDFGKDAAKRMSASASNLSLLSLGPFMNDESFFRFRSGDVESRIIVGPWSESVAERTHQPRGSLTPTVDRVTLDRHLPITAEIRVPPLTGAQHEGWAPLVGRRVRFGVTVAPMGDVIGFHGAVTTASEAPTWWPAITQERSIADFRERFQHLRLVKLPPPSLAYQVFESDEAGNDWLYPIWVYRPTIRNGPGSKTIELPIIAMPASRFPIAQPYQPAPPPSAPTEPVQAAPLIADASTRGAPGARFSTGAWWVQLENDVIHADQNARNFAATLPASKWNVLKVDGDRNELRDDWLARSQEGIERTDLAYYAGHAGPFGWHFNKRLSPAFSVAPCDVGAMDTRKRFFGRDNKLKWVGICACGPLQDNLGRSMPNLKERWSRAFDGLHTLMGYATIIDARPRTGPLFATHLQTCTVIDAWLTTARQFQFGTSVRVAVLYGFACGDPKRDPLLDSVGRKERIADPSEVADTFITICTSA